MEEKKEAIVKKKVSLSEKNETLTLNLKKSRNETQ